MTRRAHQRGFLGDWLGAGLAPMAIVLALTGGAIALLLTPREEEPQIDVPLIDIFVSAPGLTAAEVERRIVWPMEQTLFGTRGVEYVYSTSFRDGAIVTARFYVGQSPVDSEVRVRNRLERNRHRYSPELADYQIRPVYVDDVPFMTLTLHSETVDEGRLLSLGEEYLFELTTLEGVGLVFIVGGRNEKLAIELDPQRMAAHGVTLAELQRIINGSNVRISAGSLTSANSTETVVVGGPLPDADAVRELVVGRHGGKPVLLADVADVRERIFDAERYAFFAPGPAAGGAGVNQDVSRRSAVTLALAKRPDANAVAVSAQVRDKLDELEPVLGAAGVDLTITRDYGGSANAAVNWLVFSLVSASIIVMAVLAASLGVREAVIVAVSVPTTFGIALLVNYLAGFSLNRVTLFALIVALGLIVDDSIVSIDNIHRHLNIPGRGDRSRLETIVAAVREVVPPMILTSLVVVVAFIPLAFVTGLMGPYMAPMALTVPVTMLTSTVVAVLIVPWLAQRILQRAARPDEPGPTSPTAAAAAETDGTARYRLYARVVSPFLDRRRYALGLILVLSALFVLALAMPFLGLIPLKLLPYDDAEKLQLVVDQEEGATVEDTAALNQELAAFLLRQREVVDVTAYAGDASPVDFNGLVRGYYLRQGPHVGDIRINLVEDDRRRHSSHQISLRVRQGVEAIARRYGAVVKTVQRPPGPPVLAPVVAEVSGPPDMPYGELRSVAQQVRELLREEPGVVDVDATLEAAAPRWVFAVDRQKAAMVGVVPEEVGRLVGGVLRGTDASLLREAEEIRPRPIRLRLPAWLRDQPSRIADLPVTRVDERVLTVGELGTFRRQTVEQTVERKNLRRVIYVTGDVAGRTPTDVVFDLGAEVEALQASGTLNPDAEIAFDGEGEWFITRRVFRDLGFALGVAVLAIYAMLVYQTRSYAIGIILLTSLPLTLIGIMPGFWLLNVLLTTETAGYAVGIPFTATGMIGLVALAGIAVRNAILLIDFTRNRERAGIAVRQALLEAGALRTRPILLTAGTAMLAVIPIAFDPVFASLAWSLIFGLLVSTLFTLVLVPTLYFLLRGRQEASAT
jgi:multidrug efflux pump subunit AcrB